ncbi:MAG: hypothetical protein KC456_05145 [Flavobacteriales bacterium]|nr:hypothetical protein [Flavobacteriales bacterium]
MTSPINISNYEAYVLDFLEGTMSDDLKLEFDAFLIANPEIAIEIDGLSDAELFLHSGAPSVDSEQFMLKPMEVEGVNEENYESIFSLSVDEDLNPEMKKAAAAFVRENKFLASDYALYQKTKVEPDLAVTFGSTSSLTKTLPLWSYSESPALRIAASILILFGLFSVWNVFDSELYTPRKTTQDFVALSIPVIEASSIQEEKEMQFAAIEVAPQPELEELNNIYRGSIQTLAALADIGSGWEPTAPAQRDLPSLTFELPSPIEGMVTYASVPAQEALSIGQFLGQEFLGVEPGKASTTKALLKESAKKIIQQNDQIALNTSMGDDEKKTFSLMAGAIEFKRITYKAN